MMATQPMPPAAFWAVQGVLMLMAPLLNLIPCFGEEWGWRGYLLPKVAQRMSTPCTAQNAAGGIGCVAIMA